MLLKLKKRRKSQLKSNQLFLTQFSANLKREASTKSVKMSNSMKNLLRRSKNQVLLLLSPPRYFASKLKMMLLSSSKLESKLKKR